MPSCIPYYKEARNPGEFQIPHKEARNPGKFKMLFSCLPVFLIIRKPGIQENSKFLIRKPGIQENSRCFFHAFLHSLL